MYPFSGRYTKGANSSKRTTPLFYQRQESSCIFWTQDLVQTSSWRSSCGRLWNPTLWGRNSRGGYVKPSEVKWFLTCYYHIAHYCCFFVCRFRCNSSGVGHTDPCLTRCLSNGKRSAGSELWTYWSQDNSSLGWRHCLQGNFVIPKIYLSVIIYI